MPRGFVEIYSEQSKIELFSEIEKMLGSINFCIEHPSTHHVQIWNKDGDMIEIAKDEIKSCIEAGMLITFWNDHCDNISIYFDESKKEISNSILFVDGFDEMQSEKLLDAFITFFFSQKNNIKGIVFDRREISEGIEWINIFDNKLDVDNFIKPYPLEIVWEKSTAESVEISINEFHENNAYVALKAGCGKQQLFELRRT